MFVYLNFAFYSMISDHQTNASIVSNFKKSTNMSNLI